MRRPTTETTLLMIATLFSAGLSMTTDYPVVWLVISAVFATVLLVLTAIEWNEE